MRNPKGYYLRSYHYWRRDLFLGETHALVHGVNPLFYGKCMHCAWSEPLVLWEMHELLHGVNLSFYLWLMREWCMRKGEG